MLSRNQGFYSEEVGELQLARCNNKIWVNSQKWELLIQRVHYNIGGHLREHKMLEALRMRF